MSAGSSYSANASEQRGGGKYERGDSGSTAWPRHGRGDRMTRVLVVADHPLAVRNIRLSLRQTTGFETIGLDGVGAANGGIRAALAQTRPDVVLIDDMHDQDDTLQRVREVAEGAPEAKTLLLTRHSDSRWLDQAFEAGAEVVLSKSINPLAVGTLLREVV